MTRVQAINLLTLEKMWYSVPSAFWMDEAKHHAAMHWGVCWDSVAILHHRHL
jgi:hypothetical protein